jgi:hypothetical protein
MRQARPVEVVFHEVDRLRFRRWRARIRVQAVEVIVTGDDGTTSADGLKLMWRYNEAAQELKVTCTERPWWAMEAAVRGRIRSSMEGL